MRQAGRYMKEYRALRQRYSLLDLCRTPDLATEVTLQPVRSIDLDAAILFSDLLLPLGPMGIGFDFVGGEGPVIDQPLRHEADFARLRRFDPREELAYVLEAIGQIKRELAGHLPLIGFAGAPFTLASYAIEGGHSSSFAHTKALMYGAPATWHRFCEMAADLIGEYLVAQVEAGVDAVQVFDSWVGVLDARDYREFVLPHTRRLFEAVAPLGVPTIHFGVGTSAILGELREAGGDVIGVDWRLPLDVAWDRIGFDRAIQGNLDTAVLYANADVIRQEAARVLAAYGRGNGHVFNLGHGIHPHIDPENVAVLVDAVHELSKPYHAGK